VDGAPAKVRGVTLFVVVLIELADVFTTVLLLVRARQAKSKVREQQFHELVSKAKGRALTKQVGSLFFATLTPAPFLNCTLDFLFYTRWSWQRLRRGRGSSGWAVW
jgi:hypothetical protein